MSIVVVVVVLGLIAVGVPITDVTVVAGGDGELEVDEAEATIVLDRDCGGEEVIVTDEVLLGLDTKLVRCAANRVAILKDLVFLAD